jgi:hypothetical protein
MPCVTVAVTARNPPTLQAAAPYVVARRPALALAIVTTRASNVRFASAISHGQASTSASFVKTFSVGGH